MKVQTSKRVSWDWMEHISDADYIFTEPKKRSVLLFYLPEYSAKSWYKDG